MSIRDLFAAIEDADVSRVESLLKSDPTLANQTDGEHDALWPLHLAIDGAVSSLGRRQIVTALISAGADVNTIGDDGRAPLHLAVRHGLASVVKELVDGGARIDVSDGCDTPLDISARADDSYCVGFLLLRGAAVSIQSSVLLNRVDWLEWLLCYNPNALREWDQSSDLLCTAVQLNNLTMLRLLITHGGVINPSLGNSTPLWRAVDRRRFDMVKLLLEAAADPNGCRPLEPLPNWQYPGWSSPLEIAREIGSPEIEAILKEYGATE